MPQQNKKPKSNKSVGAIVETMIKNIKHLEEIAENLNDNVATLQAKETYQRASKLQI
jgi:hypothetical protein